MLVNKIKYCIQKKLWGFNDLELMDLDMEFSSWIIEKIKNVKNLDETLKIKMIRAFSLNLYMDCETIKNGSLINLENYNKEIIAGLNIFIKQFRLFPELKYDVIDWFVPRLKRFIATTTECPSGYINENGEFVKDDIEDLNRWKNILMNILVAFQYLNIYLDDVVVNNKKSAYKVYIDIYIIRGLNLFVRHYNNLWH